MFSLADAILQKDYNNVRYFLRHKQNINEIDEYGYTPLIEAAINNDVEMSRLLLEHHADPNMQDVVGGTPLHWAVENNNLELCQLLLDHKADPNAYNFAGQPVMVIALLRQQRALKNLLIRHQADLAFAQDFINAKFLGHLFELVGNTTIVSPRNKLVEVDFEGFYLETTLGLISESLIQFQNHFAARKLRRFSSLTQFIVEVLQRASELIKYQQYQIKREHYQGRINQLLSQEPVLIPVGYEGHAITFIKKDNIWIKCDRREDSRLYDNIMFYQIQQTNNMNFDLLKQLIYEKNSSSFINQDLEAMLGLKPITELKIEAQVSGNCSWANVEAVIPSLFFLVLMQLNTERSDIAYFKTLALNFFHRWREWNQDRALQFCIQSYHESDPIRKACKAEILAAILFQSCDLERSADKDRIESILSILIKSPYEYLLQNYLRVYYYETNTPKGKSFANLLKAYGYLKK